MKRYLAKHSWQLIIFSTIHVVIFLFWFQSPIYDKLTPGFSGFLVFWDYSSNIAQGLLPYRDFAVEYPPLGMVFITLPRLITTSADTYWIAFVIEMLLFDLAGLFIIAGLAKRLGLSLWQTLVIYTLALLAIGRIISIRYDLVPAILTALAIYAFIRGKYKVAWALLAAGTFTKIYPIVIAPVFLLYHVRTNTKRQIISGVITFAVTSAAIVVLPLLWSPGGFWQSFTYHAERGLQLESIYSSFLLVCQAFGLTSLATADSFGSVTVTSAVANLLAQISPLIVLFSLVTAYWLFYRERRESTAVKKKFAPLNQSDAACIVKYSFLAILVFIITNKVLSSQFIIWLYPLIPLLVGRWRSVTWIIFIITGVMTYFVYPVYYRAIISGSYLAVGLLFVRNMLLIVLAYLVAAKASERQEKVGNGIEE